MSDQGWQNAVLQELGVPGLGLVTAANPAGHPAAMPPDVVTPSSPSSPAQSSPSQVARSETSGPTKSPQVSEPSSQVSEPPVPPVPPEPPKPLGSLPPEAVPVLTSPPKPAAEAASSQSAPPAAEPDSQPDSQPEPEFPRSEPAAPPLSAPPAETYGTHEDGRESAGWAADSPSAYQLGDTEPPGAAEQQYPDLVHPDLAFPDLAHPSLGLSGAEPSRSGPAERNVQNAEGWQQQQEQQQEQRQRDRQDVQNPELTGTQQRDQQAASGQWLSAQPAPPGLGVPAGELLRNKRHGDPLIRRVGRGLSKAVGASAGQDARESADLTSRLLLPVPTCRRIAVTSIRGGAGKTTVAGLTATVLTRYRQDRVLAADADSGLGSLPLRMGVQTVLSLQDLARARPRSWQEVTRFLAQSADGLWVLSNTSGGRIGTELGIETFRSATGEMSRYFSAIFIDCGAGLLPELQRGILAEAHAQVLVTPATVDGALSARGALDWMAGNGYGALLPRTVVTLVTHSPHEDADLERARHMLSAGGMTVVHVPYDRHLAGGTPIELALTGEAAQHAATRIAAEVFSRAVSV